MPVLVWLYSHQDGSTRKRCRSFSPLWPCLIAGEGAFAVVELCHYTARLKPVTEEGGDSQGGSAPASPSGSRPTIPVAVKKLKPAIVSHQEDLESFMAEVWRD